MRTWRFGAAVGAVVATLVISSASCGDDDDNGGGAAPPQVDADPLHLEIQSVTIPEGANPRPVVRFRVTDQAGAPVDLMTELGNWNLGIPTAANRTVPNTVPRFTLAQLEDDGDYHSLYSATVAAKAFTSPGGPALPAADATQAAYEPPARAGTTPVAWPIADLVAVGNGVFDYTMPAATDAAIDRTKTHTAAGWIVRARTALDSDVAYDSFNFVPGGGTAQLDEVVSDGACNRCHGVLQAHGTRRGTQLCITCHSPQTTDPETSRTVDFKVMVHKIHMGGDLPSVQQGNPYFIVGNSQNVADFSEIAFPWHDGVQHCTVCHTGGEDSDNWRARPNLAACSSCHDNVKFDGSAATPCVPAPTPGYSDCNHAGGMISVANTSDSDLLSDLPRRGRGERRRALPPRRLGPAAGLAGRSPGRRRPAGRCRVCFRSRGGGRRPGRGATSAPEGRPMRIRGRWAMAVVAAGLGLAGCGNDDDDGGGGGGGGAAPAPAQCVPPATATVTFAANVHPILSRTGQLASATTTGCGDCHGASSSLPKYGSATLAESYAAVSAAVNTQAPDDSLLLKKGNVTTGTTHAGGDRLSDAEAAAIRQWIAECARNN